MSWLPEILARRRLIISVAWLLSLTGLMAWLTMPREEDPQFPERNALLVLTFPGADAEMIERLVVEPVEEWLAEVEEVRLVESTARANVAIVSIELDDAIYDTATAWDEVESALDRAATEFPDGVSPPVLDSDLISVEAIVLAVRGGPDPLARVKAAEWLKRELLRLEPIKRIKVIGDPGEQVTVAYDDGTARRLGLDPRALGQILEGRTQVVPGGTVRLGDRSASLRPRTELESVEELERTQIVLASGAAIPLSSVATVRRGPADPPVELMRLDGESVVGLGLMPKNGIDSVRMGRLVRERLEELRPQLEPFEVEEVIFQPDQVEERLSQLSRSLLIGILIVASVLFAAMGLRLGFLVALIVPLVTFASVAVFAVGGGILHQISIAALVIALGMLVDNAIVVAESIQVRLDAGVPMREASSGVVRELALPLGAATGTTLAAFVPMLISKGPTADFTRSIPLVIMLTLTVSYLFAILVTPVLAELLLRPRREARESRLAVFGRRIAAVTLRRPVGVLASIAALVLVTALAGGWVEQQFFPAADRSTVVLELELAEGTHIDETTEVVAALEREVLARDDVRSASSYIGRAAPHFYYNLFNRPSSPHRADLVVETRSLGDVSGFMAWVGNEASAAHPEVQLVARRLEQGPPVSAPVEIRLHGDDLGDLERGADAVLAVLRDIEGTRDVRHSLGLGQPTVALTVDDAAAGRYGLSRVDVALALLGRTQGIDVGQYRADDDPVPIVVRSSAGERYPVADLEAMDVAAPGGQPTPLGQIARIRPEWRAASIVHRDGRRTATVSAQLSEGATSIAVLDQLAAVRETIEIPDGITVELGGEVEESGQANSAILRAAPIGVLMLLFFLLLEFESFRRVGIIFVTVPLAAVGVVPGLLLARQPFGFMSMLGLVALVGIVVNNAIVLLDVIERERREGASVGVAIEAAIAERLRPILLTMATTIAGLMPLAVSDTTLWPPLAWAMISGLAASTVLTLFAVPALYRLMFRDGAPRPRPVKAAVATAAIVLALGAMPSPVRAEAPPRPITFDEAMRLAAERPAADAARARARSVEHGATAVRRAGLLPILGFGGDTTWRDETVRIETPVGPFELGEKHSRQMAVEVRQPIFQPASQLYETPAARAEADAAGLGADRTVETLVAEAADRYLDVLRLDAQVDSTVGFVESLEAELAEMEARVAGGRALEADGLKLRLDLETAELELYALEQARDVATEALARSIGVTVPVDVAWDGRWDRGEAPDRVELVAAALAVRRDLLALDLQLAARRLEAQAISAEALPRLEARGVHLLADGDPFLPSSSNQISVNLVWNPLAGFTRGPRADSKLAEIEALEAELVEARRGVALEIHGAVNLLATAREAVTVGDRRVELATENARVERERHAVGRVTTNDLLVAETVLRESRQLAAIARVEALSAWIELELVTGALGW